MNFLSHWQKHYSYVDIFRILNLILCCFKVLNMCAVSFACKWIVNIVLAQILVFLLKLFLIFWWSNCFCILYTLCHCLMWSLHNILYEGYIIGLCPYELSLICSNRPIEIILYFFSQWVIPRMKSIIQMKSKAIFMNTIICVILFKLV